MAITADRVTPRVLAGGPWYVARQPLRPVRGYPPESPGAAMSGTSPLGTEGPGVRNLLPSLSIQRDLICVGPALVAGAWIALPLGFGLLFGQLGPAVLASIGALNVLLILMTTQRARRWKVFGLAAPLNALAFTVGAALGTGPILLAVPLSGLGILLIEVVSYRAALPEVIIVVSACFVIGLGLNTTGAASLPDVFGFFLLGGLWALVLVPAVTWWNDRRLASFPPPDRTVDALAGVVTRSQWVSAIVTGIAISVGLLVGYLLKLPRDYWVLLTIVVVMRSSLTATLERAGSRISGTIVGAGVGGIVTVLFLPQPVSILLLVGFMAAALAFQRANYLLYALFLTPFVIVLLNLLAPAGVTIAIDRVIDTLIGGVIGASALLVAGIVVRRWHCTLRSGGSRQLQH